MTVAARASGCGCDEAALGGGLLPLDAALSRIARDLSPVSGVETVPLEVAAGRILAAPLCARTDLPPFDNAAMDGYALDTRDLTGGGPWLLQVEGRIPAGHKATALLPGHAARIFTGAPMPAGANAVIMQEEVSAEGGAILFRRMPQPGQNIRWAGEEMKTGTKVLRTGQRLDARAIAACAALGHGTLPVRRRLRVALVVTGDELAQPGQHLSGGAIWDVNTAMLRASLSGSETELVGVHHSADTRGRLADMLATLSETCDLIVTTGAVSVGEEDHVVPALTSLGARMIFSGVAIKPGKPVSAGRVGGAVWLGLPGNPLSAFVTWQVIGRAIHSALCGSTGPGTVTRRVVAGQRLSHKPGRLELRPARLAGEDRHGRALAHCEAATHSGRVAGLAEADGVLLLPAEAESLPAGGLVEFLPFVTC